MAVTITGSLLTVSAVWMEGVLYTGIALTHEITVSNIHQGKPRDWVILRELAERLGRGQYFNYNSPREIFEELRIASKGGNAD